MRFMYLLFGRYCILILLWKKTKEMTPQQKIGQKHHFSQTALFWDDDDPHEDTIQYHALHICEETKLLLP